MNYSECNKILKYLEKDQLEKLRAYVEERRLAYYYENARKLFPKYLKTNFSYYNIVDGKLLFTDGYSVYLLNDSSMLTNQYIERLKHQNAVRNNDTEERLFSFFDKFEAMSSDTVGEVETFDYKGYEVFNSDKSYSHVVNKNYYNNGEIFLGENTVYKVVKEEPVFLLDSPRGKGLVLGAKPYKRR